MYFNSEDIATMHRVKRLKLINSITGIKPANLIGTISEDGLTNVAIFSSVVHLGSNPPLIGFIMRPQQDVARHTLENILANKVYTINHVHANIIKKAHYTSVKFDSDESEFEHCKLTATFVSDFKAPFVEESHLKFGLRLKEIIPIPINGTSLVIGEIEHLIVPDKIIDAQDYINFDEIDTVGIGGLNTYYSINKLDQFPYARRNELPGFD